jgi:hypothetical protein
MPNCLRDVYQRFGETYCLHLHGGSGVRTPIYLKDAGNASFQNISNLVPTIWHHIPQDTILHISIILAKTLKPIQVANLQFDIYGEIKT